MSEPKSPPGVSVLSVTVKLLAAGGLTLLLFFGWCLTKIGKPAFDAGADLETWARKKLREIGR